MKTRVPSAYNSVYFVTSCWVVYKMVKHLGSEWLQIHERFVVNMEISHVLDTALRGRAQRSGKKCASILLVATVRTAFVSKSKVVFAFFLISMRFFFDAVFCCNMLALDFLTMFR